MKIKKISKLIVLAGATAALVTSLIKDKKNKEEK